jgi:hypothetical protein
VFIKKLFRKFRTHLSYEIIENQRREFENQKREFETQRREFGEIKSDILFLTYMISCQYQDNPQIQQRIKQILELTQFYPIRFFLKYEINQNASTVFNLLSPMNVLGQQKIRFGDSHDGGYVSIEPEIKKDNDGIAYSFGISTSDPWSMDMVKRGYNVFQYDGTIENSPDNHPMIHFYRFMITGSSDSKPNEKNFKQILKDHEHDGKNIILNIDIEGSEWDFFDSLTKEEILQFEQIIVEFHGFYPEKGDIFKRINILKKINETHQCIHIHGNNFAPVTILKELRLLPVVMEVSYIRKDPKYEFTKCIDEFPGKLDAPNAPFLPDIYIGIFNGGKDIE